MKNGSNEITEIGIQRWKEFKRKVEEAVQRAPGTPCILVCCWRALCAGELGRLSVD